MGEGEVEQRRLRLAEWVQSMFFPEGGCSCYACACDAVEMEIDEALESGLASGDLAVVAWALEQRRWQRTAGEYERRVEAVGWGSPEGEELVAEWEAVLLARPGGWGE